MKNKYETIVSNCYKRYIERRKHAGASIGFRPICQLPVGVRENNIQDGINVWHKRCKPAQVKIDEAEAKCKDLLNRNKNLQKKRLTWV